jgi:hypothetical protein
MEFFKTADGRRHGLRIAGVIYIVGLIPVLMLDGLTQRNLMWLVYTAGWWLAFADKRPAPTTRDLLRDARRLAGLALVVVGLFGSFYVASR